jgi:hypothetical protein
VASGEFQKGTRDDGGGIDPAAKPNYAYISAPITLFSFNGGRGRVKPCHAPVYAGKKGKKLENEPGWPGCSGPMR